MPTNRIPLSQRLDELDGIGCSDLTALHLVINAWATAPARTFFLKEEDWDRMKEELCLEPDSTYRQMAWKLYARLCSPESEEQEQRSREALCLLSEAVTSLEAFLRRGEQEG